MHFLCVVCGFGFGYYLRICAFFLGLILKGKYFNEGFCFLFFFYLVHKKENLDGLVHVYVFDLGSLTDLLVYCSLLIAQLRQSAATFLRIFSVH